MNAIKQSQSLSNWLVTLALLLVFAAQLDMLPSVTQMGCGGVVSAETTSDRTIPIGLSDGGYDPHGD